MRPDHLNSLSLKILAINPYNSKILMLSTRQLHYFHRPEGEGYPVLLRDVGQNSETSPRSTVPLSHPSISATRPGSVQRGPRRSSQQRGVHVRDVVMAFAAAPGKHHRDHGEAAGTEGEAGSEAMLEVTESEIAAGCRHSSLVGHELRSEWSPDRVLEILLQQQEIGPAKAVVAVAAQGQRSIQVSAPE